MCTLMRNSTVVERELRTHHHTERQRMDVPPVVVETYQLDCRTKAPIIVLRLKRICRFQTTDKPMGTPNDQLGVILCVSNLIVPDSNQNHTVIVLCQILTV
jgi:hypothetical protein